MSRPSTSWPRARKTWMPGTSPGMTKREICGPSVQTLVSKIVPTKACLQSSDCDESRDEIEESSKTSIGLFVACCDASECLKMAEEVLDQMAPFVHFVIMR